MPVIQKVVMVSFNEFNCCLMYFVFKIVSYNKELGYTGEASLQISKFFAYD